MSHSLLTGISFHHPQTCLYEVPCCKPQFLMRNAQFVSIVDTSGSQQGTEVPWQHPMRGGVSRIQTVRSTAVVPPLHLGPSHGFTPLADSIDSTPAIGFVTVLFFGSAGMPVLRMRRVGVM